MKKPTKPSDEQIAAATETCGLGCLALGAALMLASVGAFFVVVGLWLLAMTLLSGLRGGG